MPDWKLIALDMDGTSLDLGLDISEENRHWMQRAMQAGVAVTFATGRHILGPVRQFMRELGMTWPVVTLNGGEVWTADDRLLERHPLHPDDIRFLYDLARQFDVHWWATTVDGVVSDVDIEPHLRQATWLKFGFYADNMDTVERIWALLESRGRYELSNSNPNNIEVNPRGVTKASGLQTVCDHLGITQDQVIVMGDSLNDIPMMRWAGLGVAMGNAQERVKQEADFVTDVCEAHGVARAIERLLSDRITTR
ncbi:Cof-type HAD-IIB family hydrolase [Alicyclobacillus shizuokensis]|uniref:Cof-type HAD-IIB family hydrolase n=1 Tax=Alicyclobacillus shizuokensis TaxID=392014 RepID=UPI000832802A|nr:Cof-type HAD-IIB family hydrolase [Alicyclobacillus shizuokensis]MCL6626635.1 Cof-type HAD-IIB family hydrolase [Alicyclobacillus shizuokensis]